MVGQALSRSRLRSLLFAASQVDLVDINACATVRSLDAGLQLGRELFVVQMIEFVGLGVLHRVYNDVGVVVLYNTAVFQHDASLHTFLRVLGGFDFDLRQEKKQKTQIRSRRRTTLVTQIRPKVLGTTSWPPLHRSCRHSSSEMQLEFDLQLDSTLPFSSSGNLPAAGDAPCNTELWGRQRRRMDGHRRRFPHYYCQLHFAAISTSSSLTSFGEVPKEERTWSLRMNDAFVAADHRRNDGSGHLSDNALRS